MRLRLKTNVSGHRFGSEVEASELGDALTKQLLETGMAEEVTADDTPRSTAERLQIECFELADQLASMASRVALLASLFGQLEDAERGPALDLLAAAYVLPPELASDEVRDLMAQIADHRGDGIWRVGVATDGANAPDADAETAGATATDAASGAIAPQAAGDASDSQGSDASSPHTPPTQAEPSSDATGASASAAEPAAPSPAKPATKIEGGAAKAKKSGG